MASWIETCTHWYFASGDTLNPQLGKYKKKRQWPWECSMVYTWHTHLGGFGEIYKGSNAFPPIDIYKAVKSCMRGLRHMQFTKHNSELPGNWSWPTLFIRTDSERQLLRNLYQKRNTKMTALMPVDILCRLPDSNLSC